MDILRAELNLKESDFPDDTDISIALAGLFIEATNRKSATYTLEQVHKAIIAAQLSREIDPLSTVPILLPSSDDAAKSVLDTIAENTSAKELVIACEEATERLKTNLISTSEDDDDDFDSLTSDEYPQPSPAQQVVRLLHIYAKALPRLKRGKRTPSETMKPLLSELVLLIRFLGQNADLEDSRALVAAVSYLVLSLAPWIAIDGEDRPAASETLYSLMISTLEVCAESVSVGIAQRAFEKHFPRLRMPAAKGESSSHGSEDPVGDALHALAQISFTTPDFEKRMSIGALVLLSHTTPYTPSIPTVQAFLPVLIASIQTNTALEDTLAFLLSALGPLSPASSPELPPDLLVPLAHVLPPLAGAHPDAPIRHIIFRILARVLALAPPLLRFQLLLELLTDGAAEDQTYGDGEADGTSAQMRVAAVGLVREAVLDALNEAAQGKGRENAFASPKFMQTFAPVVFRPRLPEGAGVEGRRALEEFLRSPEPLRLVEGLGLYYVVLQRDTGNLTGIRDASSMKTVEQELISVLRARIAAWNKVGKAEPDDAGTDEDEDHLSHDTMQLGILEMWLDRIQAAMDALRV